MDMRPASAKDLPGLKKMYMEIVADMGRRGLNIWDETYPVELLGADIEGGSLYVLEENGEIAAAFALCCKGPGRESVEWENKGAKALYLDRLGVSVWRLRRGVGSEALKKAAALAKEKGAEYLRLFVVDSNLPAIKLYERNGFHRAKGILEEKIDEDLILREYGFELGPLSDICQQKKS